MADSGDSDSDTDINVHKSQKSNVSLVYKCVLIYNCLFLLILFLWLIDY